MINKKTEANHIIMQDQSHNQYRIKRILIKTLNIDVVKERRFRNCRHQLK